MNLETLLTALTPANDRVPVAVEIDAAFDGDGKLMLGKLASNGELLQEMRAALSASGSVTKDGMVFPILSPRRTDDDAVYFRQNPSRAHLIREAIDGEPVLNGRSPASEYVTVVRQIRSGFRILVAIEAERLCIDRATGAAWLNSDDVLAALFDLATGGDPSHYIYIDGIIAYVGQMRSAAAAAGGLKRRLQ
jgi:hypothetical protein